MAFLCISAVRYQPNIEPAWPIPVPLLLTCKGSLCRREQCVVIYEMSSLHLANSEQILRNTKSLFLLFTIIS